MKRLSHTPICFYGFLFVVVLMLCSACGNDDQNIPAPSRLAPSFSFFDVGVNTPFSHKLRKSLQDILGDDAVSSRNTIDLHINTDGFLSRYYPSLHALNDALNFPPGERVEHDTTTLTYRYAVKKALPFEYVELLFSKHSRMPMVIRVFFEEDHLNILDSLKNKYGAPRELPWKQKNGKSLCWEKNGDILFYSCVPNQFGNPEYRVTIYFVRHLKAMLEREQGKTQDPKKSPASSTKTVF
ncbi:hypothetical protein SAMN02746065_113113 [Desulfocicer vacuolatum DSM 3385]|uniref:Uncharacterized protein n=1 Tax=Desulfocicer vacuolatum DSM 3385 TaxID=1121400 RepID=A0A1W2CSJ9_9BACT|nr:hypothetical protein [Desulfocicer vacuolatum]SMC88219.1 hypothetical protein SAMN02746065_113113 [Desulfocicer vacuolatum DSM 3385]